MSLPMPQAYRLNPRKKIRLAAALLDIFNSGQLILLGDLKQLDSRFYPLVSWIRNVGQQDNIASSYGCVSLPLDPLGVEQIRKYILYRVGIASHIHEVRIT